MRELIIISSVLFLFGCVNDANNACNENICIDQQENQLYIESDIDINYVYVQAGDFNSWSWRKFDSTKPLDITKYVMFGDSESITIRFAGQNPMIFKTDIYQVDHDLTRH